MSCMKIGDEEVLTTTQAAERIGVSPDTLQSQIRRGKIAAERFGRQWMIKANELQRYRDEVQGKHGFAAPSHPLHGKRGGGRRKKGDTGGDAA